MLLIVRSDSSHADFLSLVILLDEDLAMRDGEEHAFYAQFNKVDSLKNVLVAYEDGTAIACGAFKPFATDKVEIKRMFVKKEYRGKGISKKILSELENWAGTLGYRSCVLETGKKQVEAIQLYKDAGYTFIPNYGQYVNIENSICMEKSLNYGSI